VVLASFDCRYAKHELLRWSEVVTIIGLHARVHKNGEAVAEWDAMDRDNTAGGTPFQQIEHLALRKIRDGQDKIGQVHHSIEPCGKRLGVLTAGP
jgi:hypothetical protein